MVADQRKKRLSAASAVGYTLRDVPSLKRKKLVSPLYDSSIRSNITLEWDDKRKSVVAKKEQIGIAHRDLSPFIDGVPSCHSILGDVANVPPEIFELENLAEVLSFEVWQTHLSEKERDLLSQFLPEGAEAQQVVQELLEGDNFHFGNPFVKWGSSLCAGDCHPDSVFNKECLLRANKKAYYLELQKYHHDMIKDLQILKGRWLQKDHENDMDQTIWRSRKHADKTLATHANRFTLHDFENNVTSESCSSAADDKTCSSDELNSVSLYEDAQRRKVFLEDTCDNVSDRLKLVARQRRGEKLQRRNVQCGDGAKYMSYIKVSKEQHQRVKSSMKHSSNSIQSRSLNHVLGDLGTYYVQPYKVFEEEEQLKLHMHWSKLANVDVAAAHTNWRRMQIEKRQIISALGQETVEKVKCLKEDVEKKDHINIQVDDEESDIEPSISTEDEETEISDNLLQEQIDNAVTDHEPSAALEDGDHISPNCTFQQQTDNAAVIDEPVLDDETECVSNFSENHHLQHNTLLGGNHVFRAMDLGLDDNHVMPEADVLVPNVSKYIENLGQVDIPLSRENPLSVATDVWPAGSMSNAYYNSNHNYASAGESSHGLAQVIEAHQTELVNLKPSDMRKLDPGTDLLCRQSDDVFFSSYPNQVQNGQFQSFFKGTGSLPYRHEQKPTILGFQPLGNVMIENSQPVGHFRDQLHPSIALDLGQKKLKDPFMHQTIHENLYLDGVRHAVPRQEHFLTPNMQNWGANTVQLSGLPQSHSNGGEFLNQNWRSGDNQGPGSWSGLEGTVCQNQSFVNGSVPDQSLFSVLSQCSDMNPGVAPHNTLIPQERFSQSVNYSGPVGIVPATSNILPQMVTPHNYLSGHETTNGLKTNNTGWVNLPQQNTALHDSMGKSPYLRYWNN